MSMESTLSDVAWQLERTIGERALLRAQLEVAESERDALRAAVDAMNNTPIQTACDDCKADRDALRAVLREVMSIETRTGLFIPPSLIERAEKLLEGAK